MSRANKRQRRGDITPFGAATKEDTESQTDVPSALASSIRALPVTSVPSLVTLCARVFVNNFKRLRNDETLWKLSISGQLSSLPPYLIPKIFAMLSSSIPSYLPHELIVAHFMKGPVISLSSSLTGVNTHTLVAISRMNPALRELHLSGFSKIKDQTFSSALLSLKSLKVLVLRGCSSVAQKTTDAIATSCHLLQVLNLNYTSIVPAAAALVIEKCTELEVLKLAGLSKWTIVTSSKFSSEERTGELCLKTLKLRNTAVSDSTLHALLSRCPRLTRLDLSLTPISHRSFINHLPLEKLSLTSTNIAINDLLHFISFIPSLKILSLGGLGVQKGIISNSSAMTMDDNALRRLTDILESCNDLESVNLLGNTKLGVTSKADSPLMSFISRVGRRCKALNLSAIPSLRSFELSGLLPPSDVIPPSKLIALMLNNTGVDDDAAPFIAGCPNLTTLEVSGTRMTETGLFSIVDSCPNLQFLDLTSCRGVPVTSRRRFFEKWEKIKQDS